MKHAHALLLLPFTMACARPDGGTVAPDRMAAASSASVAAKRVTLLVTGDVGGKYAPCG